MGISTYPGTSGGPVQIADYQNITSYSATFLTAASTKTWDSSGQPNAGITNSGLGRGGTVVLCTVSGTATGINYHFEGSVNNVDWVQLPGINASNGAVVNTVTNGTSPLAHYIYTAGWINIRVVCTAYASGSSVVQLQSVNAGSLPVPVPATATPDSSFRSTTTIVSGQSASIIYANCSRVAWFFHTTSGNWGGSPTLVFEVTDDSVRWHSISVTYLDGSGAANFSQTLPNAAALKAYMTNQAGGSIAARARCTVTGTGGIVCNAVATP